jgi:hypothetical protein
VGGFFQVKEGLGHHYSDFMQNRPYGHSSLGFFQQSLQGLPRHPSTSRLWRETKCEASATLFNFDRDRIVL